ncbi:capsule biosynthesis protein [Sphingomonas crusticola]|uniref:capsule biosynthesis protein n=1 Tax=Sphingomonas crusticola TaxID=1697973 RepID=UPI001F071F7B|nr:capsular biosynthesis protein [Sphingomonas crusticola]
MANKEFLFLQGLAGPFFSRLGEALAAAGNGVHRVNFNGGDKLYWQLPGAIDYRGTLDKWPRFLAKILARRNITDILLFGDCRPLHSVAIAVAGKVGVKVHVFEEGYVRPDFVTLEAGGVNGHSRLSRSPEYYLEAARALPPVPDFPPVPSSFNRRAKEDLAYNIASLVMAPLFPGYRTHRPWHILTEYTGWALRLLRRPAERRRSAATLDRLRADGRPYFVFPLQLDCDYQIRVHSNFVGVQDAIETVLGSFAKNAPANSLLVVKGHPLDNGLVDWEKRTLAVAAKLGLSDRLLFLESVDIDSLVCKAIGLVTVNSTTGTLSLRCGVPTIVLGDAVYDMPRITHQNGLDSFWVKPVPPELPVYEAFRRVLIDRCLIHGGYFSDEGLSMLVKGALKRLESVEPKTSVVRMPAPVRVPAVAPLAARG